MSVRDKTEYALSVLLFLTEKKEQILVSSSIIARKQLISHYFLSQILLRLKKISIVRSVKRVRFDFILDRSLGTLIFGTCENTCYLPLRERCSLYNECWVKNIWFHLRTSVRKSMKSVSLSSFVTEPSLLQ